MAYSLANKYTKTSNSYHGLCNARFIQSQLSMMIRIWCHGVFIANQYANKMNRSLRSHSIRLVSDFFPPGKLIGKSYGFPSDISAQGARWEFIRNFSTYFDTFRAKWNFENSSNALVSVVSNRNLWRKERYEICRIAGATYVIHDCPRNCTQMLLTRFNYKLSKPYVFVVFL